MSVRCLIHCGIENLIPRSIIMSRRYNSDITVCAITKVCPKENYQFFGNKATQKKSIYTFYEGFI